MATALGQQRIMRLITYTEEGTFQAVFSAVGSDGGKDSQSIAVTVRNLN